MPDQERLIDMLSIRASPVRRVASPWLRAAAFLPLMLTLGWIMTTLLHRALMDWAPPAFGIGAANALLSLLLGGALLVRALAISVPGGEGRRDWWILAGLLGWLVVAAAGIGAPVGLSEAYREGRYCFTFLLTAGLPMIAIVIAALRRTRSLHPVRSLLTAGCSVAFLGFCLLAFCHPAATTVADTIGHIAAGLLLGLLTVFLGLKAVTA